MFERECVCVSAPNGYVCVCVMHLRGTSPCMHDTMYAAGMYSCTCVYVHACRHARIHYLPIDLTGVCTHAHVSTIVCGSIHFHARRPRPRSCSKCLATSAIIGFKKKRCLLSCCRRSVLHVFRLRCVCVCV